MKAILILAISASISSAQTIKQTSSAGGGGGAGSGISQSDADTRYLNVVGDTATGQINLTSATVSAHLQVATATVTSTLTVQGNAFSVGTSTFVVTGSSVGIRTASPRTALDVDGEVQFGYSASKATISVSGGFTSPSSVTASHFDSQSANFTRSMTASTASIYGNAFSVGVTTLVISIGRLGVGTASPANKLDIEGSAAVGATYSGTSAAPANGMVIEGAVGIGTTDVGADSLRITGGGNDHAMRIQQTASGASKAALVFIDNPVQSWGFGTLSTAENSSFVFRDFTALSHRLVIDTSGRFGFGALTPNAKIHMSSGTLKIDGNAAVSFQVGDSTMVVRGSGFVGIGDAEPNKKLHISSGTIKVVGTGSPTKASALCLTTAGTLTNCSSLVGADGTCTCTEP